VPITTGGFEDLVQLSADTLHYVGPDLEIGNTSVGSSASLGFNNTAGDIVLVGVATGNATINLPTGGGGTLLTNVNVSAGTTSQNLSNVVFSNSNNVSFGLNGSTVTATVPQALTEWYNAGADFLTNFVASQNTLSLQREASFPMSCSFTALGMVMDFEGATGSSGGVSFSHAVYTLSSGTASLASSASTFWSWSSNSSGASSTATTATSQYGGASGTRYRTVGISYAMTPGDYLFAYWVSTINNVTVNVFGRQGMSIVGTYQGFETARFLNGISISSTSGLPSSIAATNTNYVRTGGNVMRMPGVILVGTGG
jgi:hypothetical protein